MRVLLIIPIYVLTLHAILGQYSTTNLIPNPGFEQIKQIPQGWYYSGQHFSRTISTWNSPTAASPDLYSPKIQIPMNWQKKHFGEISAVEGENYIGLTLYGCEKGKPHCREYLQVGLKQELVPGQQYELSIWIGHLPSSMFINNIGFYFSEEPVNSLTAHTIDKIPQINIERVLKILPHRWYNFKYRFTAEAEASHLIIGNHYPDEMTNFIPDGDESFQYAYYYFDNVKIVKIPPYVQADSSDLIDEPLITGKTYELENIYFALDKAELLSASYTELNKLLKLMRENPDIQIQINGHTDILGTEIYNQDLSMARAQAVAEYLFRHGVGEGRVLFQGFGSRKPIATNEHEDGRRFNRRVEFKVLEKAAANH